VNVLTGGSRIRVLTTEPGRIPIGGHDGYDFLYHTPSGMFYALDRAGRLFGETEDVKIQMRQPKQVSAKLPAIRPSSKPTRPRP
jgi:hypothetical protein